MTHNWQADKREIRNPLDPEPELTASEQAVKDVGEAAMRGARGWFPCYGGFVDVRKAYAIVVESARIAESNFEWLIVAKMPGGDSFRLKLGPYPEPAVADAVARQIVSQLPA